VHLLDWSGDLYGQALEVEYIARLRDERRFNGLGELTEQIARDVQSARAHLAAG
jgi:riboflavin kinase/FMN adenylyltransferase